MSPIARQGLFFLGWLLAGGGVWMIWLGLTCIKLWWRAS
jgi:hypothetical protein